MVVVWVVIPCGLVSRYQHFERKFSFIEKLKKVYVIHYIYNTYLRCVINGDGN
jgi:hypothetical protein